MREAVVSTYSQPLPRTVSHAVRQFGWLVVVCFVAFLVPYLGVTVLALQHDVFYLVYFAVTVALIGTYVRVERVAVADVFRDRWRWSLGIGGAMAAFLVFNVYNTSESTARPHGFYRSDARLRVADLQPAGD